MTGEEIRELRKKLGLSQQDFAVKIGVTITSISGWETGKHKPYRLAIEKMKQIKEENKD